MAPVFTPAANTWFRLALLCIALILFICAGLLYSLAHADWATRAHEPLEQPVPFSHQHHVELLGIDCRYCHTGAETGAFAGMPATATCMTCHSQLFTQTQMLAPVRVSLAENRPIPWRRVYDLPDYVFFNHGIHVAKGIGCADCHGRIDQQPITKLVQPLTMRWCLDCHRDPVTFIRPAERIFDMAWQSHSQPLALRRKLAAQNHVQSKMDCSVCHR